MTLHWNWGRYLAPKMQSENHCIISVTYIVIFLFQSTSDSVIKKATLLSDMHLKNLRQKLLLKQRTDEAVKRLQVRNYILIDK